MKGGYFQRAEVKIQLKEGLIIQKYSCLIIEEAMVARLIGKDKVLFFVTAKAQKKLRSKFGHSDIALLPGVPYNKDWKNGFEPTIAFKVLSFIVCQVLNNEYVQKHITPKRAHLNSLYLFRTMFGFFSRRFWYIE